MVKPKKGGIEATGAPFACFLRLPSMVIKTKWSNNWEVQKGKGAIMIITGKGMHNVCSKSTMVESSKSLFATSMLTKCPTPFGDDVTTAPHAVVHVCMPMLAKDPTDPMSSEVRRDNNNADLCADSIEVVDKEPDPAPKNAVEQPPTATGQVGQ